MLEDVFSLITAQPCEKSLQSRRLSTIALFHRDRKTEINALASYYSHYLCSTSAHDKHRSFSRALDSFFPLVTLLRLKFLDARAHNWSHYYKLFFLYIWLINACWWTFIIVYSYMVTEVFNIQPVLCHQYYLWFKFCEQDLLFLCAFTFKFAILVSRFTRKVHCQFCIYLL